jgi:type I restriction enzyme S subunit
MILPPRSEQDQIVRYIDWKVSMINKYINAKKKQIELLKERKQAIINQAVTKGLDPKASMKDSGIEWLGKIPAHWEARKLKTCGLMKSGINLTSYEIENKGKHPVYGGNGLRGYYKGFNRSGDYLLIGRQGALCGNVHKVSGKFWATEHAVVVEPHKSVNLNWYYYMLIFMNLNQYSESAAQPGISVESIQNLKTYVPSLEEQKAIADYVDNKINHMDDVIKNIEGRIALIQEYRTRLISDVVTGKVNVQNIKTPKFITENEGGITDEE